MSNKIKKAWDVLQSKMSNDFDWAWGVHCNISMPILDNSNGKLTPIEANIAAASIMQHLFNYDVTGLKRYTDIVDALKKDTEVKLNSGADVDAFISELRASGSLNDITENKALHINRIISKVRETIEKADRQEQLKSSHMFYVTREDIGLEPLSSKDDLKEDAAVSGRTSSDKKHVCQCRTTEPFVDDVGPQPPPLFSMNDGIDSKMISNLGIIDYNFKILAVNPVNKKVYTEKDSVIFRVTDKGLVPFLHQYLFECAKLGADINHLNNIKKIIISVSLYQQNNGKVVDNTNRIIDRKFITLAVDQQGNICTERNSILFCAKDRAFYSALSEYRKVHHSLRTDKERIKNIDMLILRIRGYQEHVESKIPDTTGGEISRCLDGVGLTNN